MDGVTDAPFRAVMAKFGRPDVIFTEFVPVEAITHNAVRVMQDFLYSEVERPVVAQIYGGDPESFYKVAHVVCELGFDGIDINMGCPAKKVVHRGCGAGLIQTPELAKQIVRAVQRGVKDWADGQKLETLGLSNRILKWVTDFKSPLPLGERVRVRATIPVSIKTRIGYSENTVTDWVKHLLETEPVAITLHGRTLKQMYKGEADWEAIAAAAEIIRQTPTLVLGNGDIKSAADAVQKIRASKVDGVLIGRATYGNPWILTQKDDIRRAVAEGPLPERHGVTPEEAMECMLEHARCFEEIRPDIRYVAMRKHFTWYAKWIPTLRARRKELMQINSYRELVELIDRHSREGGDMKIILASTSPRRKEILEMMGVPFTAVSPTFMESPRPDLAPADEAKLFACEKAQSIAKQFPDALIIGSDTLIECDGRKIGKPIDASDAEKMLAFLCGRTHRIYTAVAILNTHNNSCTETLITIDVTMRPATHSEIAAYVVTGAPLDKAGSYAIQGEGKKFITEIKGDYWAAVGLPVEWVAQVLRKHGFLVRVIPQSELLASP
jgi:MAF protein